MLESVAFTYQQMTVIVEHERLIDRTLKKNHGLSTTDFCILRSIVASGGSVEGVGFAERLLLMKPNSLSMALNRLEKKGLVARAQSEEDRRVVVTNITAQGRDAVDRAAADIAAVLQKTFWRDFTKEEILAAVSNGYPVVERARSERFSLSQGPLTAAEDAIDPVFVAALKYIVRRWGAEAKAVSGLSLSECRILALIAGGSSPLTVADVASHLFIASSAVSLFKDALCERGFIKVVPSDEDRRMTYLTLTPEGEEIYARLTSRFTKVTADLYGWVDAQESCFLNEWHMRMYRDLMTAVEVRR